MHFLALLINMASGLDFSFVLGHDSAEVTYQDNRQTTWNSRLMALLFPRALAESCFYFFPYALIFVFAKLLLSYAKFSENKNVISFNTMNILHTQ